MSGLRLRAAPTGAIALAAATAKTVLRVKAPAQQRVLLKSWGISFDGVTAAAIPVLVEILRSSTDGTYTAQTLTKVKPGQAETIQSTAGHTATAEGTPGDILHVMYVHPTSGYAEKYAPGDELEIEGGGRLGIRCNAAAAVNCRVYMEIDE